MINFTTCANVANSFLKVLQGYTKGIRFIAVLTMLCTIGVGQMWGATWEKATSIAAGDVVLLVCESKKMELSSVNTYGSGKAYSTSPAGLYELTVEAGSSSGTFSLKNGNNYLSWNSGNSLATSTSKTTNSSWKITFNSGNLTILNAQDNTRKLQWNASSPRFACYTSSQTAVQLYKKVTAAPSFTVTATSNDNNYGTVSVSGTTITASPKTGYAYANPAYTVTEGTATVTQNGNTFTVNPSTNCTVRINFAAKPKYTVTFNAGSGTCGTSSLTESTAGAGVTLPTATICDGWEFAGWATSSVANETTAAPTTLLDEGSNYKPTGNCTLYAVYKRTETTNGGGNSVSESITIVPNTFSDKGSNSYGSGTERTGTIGNISLGGHYITGNVSNTPSGATAGTYLQCKASDATIYNKTELPGKITQVVVNQNDAKAFSLYCGSEQLMASDNTLAGQTPSGTKISDVNAATKMTWNVSGDYTFFALKKGNNASYVTSIVVTYTTSGGTITTTYYHSTPDCGGTPEQPTYTITISNDIQNGTIVADKSSAAEGETVKLTVTPEAGYKLNAITVTKATGGIVEVENKTFTMPASNVTVSATFTEIPKYTVSFSTGTGNSPQADISETVGGAGITLPDGPTPDCSEEGWEFFAWSTNNVQDLTTTAPSSLLYAEHTYKPQTNNTTLYAVYSKTESDGSGGTTATVTLTNDEIADTYVGSGDDQTTSYGARTITSESGTWEGTIIIGMQSETKYIQISSNQANYHLASPNFSNNISNITIKGRHNASKTRNIYICSSDEEAQPKTGDLGVGSIASSGVQNQFTDWTDVSITVSGNHTQFYVYADGGLQIHSIVVTTGGSTTTTYYHSNPCDDSEPITPTWKRRKSLFLWFL